MFLHTAMSSLLLSRLSEAQSEAEEILANGGQVPQSLMDDIWRLQHRVNLLQAEKMKKSR